MLQMQLAALALAATALVASGCGSSKTGSATTAAATTTPATPPVTTSTAKLATGTPLSRAQWIAQGDAICERTNAKLLAIASHSTPEFVRALPQIALYHLTESESLSKLVPPASMAHDWEQIVNDVHLYSEYANTIARYAKENQEKTAGKLLEKAIKLQEEKGAIAKRNGFKKCSLAR